MLEKDDFIQLRVSYIEIGHFSILMVIILLGNVYGYVFAKVIVRNKEISYFCYNLPL